MVRDGEYLGCTFPLAIHDVIGESRDKPPPDARALLANCRVRENVIEHLAYCVPEALPQS